MREKTSIKTALILTFFLLGSISLFLLAQNAYANPNYSNILEIRLTLRYGDMKWEFRHPDIVYSGGFDEGMSRFEKDFRGRIKGERPFYCSYDLADAYAKLREIVGQIDCEPQNAEVSFHPNSDKKFAIKEDKKGRKVDIDKLYLKIKESLSRGASAEVEIIPNLIEPEISAKKLRKATAVRSEFSTDFSYSSPERKHNIALSLRQFNGLIIPPGGEVSFNATVGPRTEARGYKEAKIIVAGEFVEGIGGGVCQTSTTLYNALLLADIKITEQHRHTLAVSYVPPSFDAMVNISTADLRFSNDSGNYIFIKTWADSGRAYVRVYGEKLDYTIKRRSTLLKVYEKPREEVVVDFEGKYKDIYEGERRVVIPSKPKMESMGELVYYKDGQIVKIKPIRKDTYMQMVGKEVIGTAKRLPKRENAAFSAPC